ncbi:MAG: pimeloyl-ACP methyl ester esterase BioH [Sideroxydans sp.]|nr:pimeloyl-ACP methyl ester esterase BioH [Sideroxydans sp.]
MSLHVEVAGQGESLVLLHGWGMHGGVWNEAAAQLAQDFRVHSVDLPGHGASAPVDTFSLDSVVEQLAAQFTQPVAVCGWSLGGQLAMHWAVRKPEQIRRLVLVATTPRFAADDGWPFGMPRATLQQFAEELEQNFGATLRRFLALQVRGSDGERELLANLRERLFSRGEPDLHALRGGLDILRDADLRSMLPEISSPALVIAGERDKLTSPQASYYLAQTLRHAQGVEIEGAAHAPFLSHRKIFVSHVTSFLNG